MSGDDTDGEHLTLVSHRPSRWESGQRPDEDTAAGDAYATVRKQGDAESLEFQRKTGTSFAMPYDYRPIIWWEPPGAILVEYPGFFTVILKGWNLKELQQRLRDRRVTWIRECDEPGAAARPGVVTHIEILNAYPSRIAHETH